ELTHALRAGLDIDQAEAERIKATVGLAKRVPSAETHKAVEIIYSVSGDLLTSLRNTISFFVSHRPDTQVGEIVLSGGGAQLPGLAVALGEMTR
ncbi:hypothetical protein ACQ1Y8_14105, partial [Enterococcus faecalis]|uniref:hypothetical protein n=1 Tax=Enterococcus faecalis TaxID=1351 RepID=UPI003D6BAE74